MSDRTLIVAKVARENLDYVAETFAESDATELPHLLNVTRRTLFGFHGLYLHLIETEDPVELRLRAIRDHPLFQDINTKLAKVVRPYLDSWREPGDAMAQPFYVWTARK